MFVLFENASKNQGKVKKRLSVRLHIFFVESNCLTPHLISFNDYRSINLCL